ncbi:hypothetical protein [Sphingobacterium sp. DR205]|uniref:hypothetical protein n=1 Tax=Sphingobacterium sp. DR205 TaxID=2713573 RepID=UPI0013E41C51|nr:hypothetical protein [Sphingobacterium sp. DR205]QIH36777.1 hypothetical protein G6053_29725 [Sphingobacterium sp. DR205]
MKTMERDFLVSVCLPFRIRFGAKRIRFSSFYLRFEVIFMRNGTKWNCNGASCILIGPNHKHSVAQEIRYVRERQRAGAA